MTRPLRSPSLFGASAELRESSESVEWFEAVGALEAAELTLNKLS